MRKVVALSLMGFLFMEFSVSAVYANWTVVAPPTVSSSWDLSGMDFLSQEEGWAVGGDYVNHTGALLHYVTGAWSSVAPPSISGNWFLTDIRSPSFQGSGWVVGYDVANRKGLILEFSHEAWNTIALPQISSDWWLEGIYFFSPDQGWAVGQDASNKRGILLRYSGGAWTAADLPMVSTDWLLSHVSFKSQDEGWAAGTDLANKKGVLLHFINGEWMAVDTPAVSPDWKLEGKCIHFSSTDEGWAVGEDSENKRGLLLHYQDGSWGEVPAPVVSSHWWLSAVYFVTSGSGWAIGFDQENQRGVFLQYDKGLWSKIDPPSVSSKWEPSDVYMVSPGEVWVVGQDSSTPNATGIILYYLNEVISPPNLPKGPTAGKYGVSYSYSTTNAASSLGHPMEYQFDWTGEGTDLSPWSVATFYGNNLNFSTQEKVWNAGGTYQVRARARCTRHPSVVSDWSAFLTVVIEGPITLQSPAGKANFDACSIYSPPAFTWESHEAFKSYEIQFSPDKNFQSAQVKMRTTAVTNPISANTWKKILSLPSSGTIYWRVVGTRQDKKTVESEIRSILMGPPQTAGTPMISPVSKGSIPTLSWQNQCGLKFKVIFGSDPNFGKKYTLTFNLKNPNDNGGALVKSLSSNQWGAIRKLVGNVAGVKIYWHIESWDGLGRYARTELMDFDLMD